MTMTTKARAGRSAAGTLVQLVVACATAYVAMRAQAVWDAELGWRDNGLSVFVDVVQTVSGGAFGSMVPPNQAIEWHSNAVLRAVVRFKRWGESFAVRWPTWVGESFVVETDGFRLVVVRPSPPANAKQDKSEGERLRLPPLVVFTHKGGFVVGSAWDRDWVPRLVARGFVVASVDYPLSPEHPFPAAHEFTERAARYVLRHRNFTQTVLGADPDRVTLAGFSAGGNLALATAQALAARPEPSSSFKGLLVAAAMLVKHDFSAATFVREYPSIAAFPNSPSLRVVDLRFFWEALLLGSTEPCDARCQPLLGSMRGLPPTIVFTGSRDGLRDENLSLIHI